jgi:uncharacterized protein (DUF885 family)
MRNFVTLAGLLLAAAAAARSPDSVSMQLQHLFAASDEANLKRNPLQALYRGDLRYAGEFGDDLSDAYFAAEKAAAVADLAALTQIDRNALPARDRVSYDVFRFQREDTLKGLDPALLKTQIERPIEHFYGAQASVPQLSSGEGAAPFKTVADYDNNLRRLAGYVVYLDRAVVRMRQGLADGITNPKLVMTHVVSQLDSLIAEGVDHSTFFKPIEHFPDTVSPSDRTRLKKIYAQFIRDELTPAHRRMRDFLKTEYLPHARDSVGLSQMPGGLRLYRHLVASATTTTMTPEEIHALGLSEVKRIHIEMEKVKTSAGFHGSLKEFDTFMRSDPQFAPASKEAMRAAFLTIDQKLQAAVPRDFTLLPKSPLELRPVPAMTEKTEAGGSYDGGTPDGSRPGVFYYNTYDLPSRRTWGFETLFLHEAIPGHHFQTSLAQENTALPAFQRFGGNTAYDEGWALYAESLGLELGLFTDPYQMYGHLNDEILRAMRLVVDTGIHAQAWDRNHSIDYMLANSAMSRTDATAEVDRYIAVPAQALAYKIGQLTIQRLRTKAEKELGSRFDVRAFHTQILMSGSVPMAVLEHKIEDWIALRQRG